MSERVFNGVAQTSGYRLTLTVQIFLDRIAELTSPTSGYGAEGKEAAALLATRGLTAAVIDEARTLIQKSVHLDESTVNATLQEQADEDKAKAVTAMWAWYLEWSEIARSNVKERALLKQLGFAQSKGSGSDELIEDASTS